MPCGRLLLAGGSDLADVDVSVDEADVGVAAGACCHMLAGIEAASSAEQTRRAAVA